MEGQVVCCKIPEVLGRIRNVLVERVVLVPVAREPVAVAVAVQPPVSARRVLAAREVRRVRVVLRLQTRRRLMGRVVPVEAVATRVFMSAARRRLVVTES
jgi:hypothetical protein